jgi:hypothetical protein
MIKYKVTLTPEEREYLQRLSGTGSHKSQKVLNALILLNVDWFLPGESGSTNATVSKILNINMKQTDRVKKRFAESGLETALCGHPQERKYDRKVDGDLEAHTVALSCSEPPKGFSRRPLRMPADRVVELEYADGISRETVRRT